MELNEIIMLPKVITSSYDLAGSFKELFGSDEAKKAKGVVYFFRSQKPIPRVRGESDILYIGKTKQTIHQRYFRYSDKLASKRSGDFYRYIIDNFGGISLGYIKVDDPKQSEKSYFKQYYNSFLEFPPKSKVG
ncbi:hypothetical protein ACSTLI_08045 [Vibrio parahaemolyticus]